MYWDKTRKKNIKGEEQKHLALRIDNTFCAKAHTRVEEVQREVCAQNESLLAAHLKGEHSIRCYGEAEPEWTCTNINSVFQQCTENIDPRGETVDIQAV